MEPGTDTEEKERIARYEQRAADRAGRSSRPDAQTPAREPGPPSARETRWTSISAVRSLMSSRAGRVLTAISGALLLVTIAGLVALWPSGGHRVLEGALGGDTVSAEVQRQVVVRCPGPAAQRCRRLIATVSQGSDQGRRIALDLGPVAVTQDIGPGTPIRVQKATGSTAYGFVDVDRRLPLLILGLVFAAIAVLVARRKGALALLGLVLSVAVVTTFLVPAILDGRPPVLVSVVAALTVMYITLALTYGVTAQSLAASTGIAASLLIATLAGDLVLHLTHLDGRGGELAPYLQQAGVGDLSLQGIVLATIVIGALGVLTDTAVTQASAVMALRHTDPQLGTRQLYLRAQGVGRDHLAATTHTLVMVYVATLLPLMLLIQAGNTDFTDAINGQFLAEPLVATLIGAIALMLSVPLTTILTALLAVHVPSAALPRIHGHSH